MGDAPAPQQCRKHQTWEHEENCRTCGADRKAYELWEADEAKKPKPVKPHVHRWLDNGTCVGCEEQQGGDF